MHELDRIDDVSTTKNELQWAKKYSLKVGTLGDTPKTRLFELYKRGHNTNETIKSGN